MKVSSMTGTIFRFGRTLNVDCHKRILQTFVLPHMRCCLPVRGNSTAGVTTHMDRTILRTARVILDDRHTELNNNTFTSHYQFRKVTFIQLCMSHYLPAFKTALCTTTNTGMQLAVIRAQHTTRSTTKNKSQRLP